MTSSDARLVLMLLALGLGACQDLTPVPPAEAAPDDDVSTDDGGGDETDDSSSEASVDDAGDAGTE